MGLTMSEHNAGAGRELRAVLWDFDGTLVDTEPLWIQAEIEVLSEFGVTWTPQDGAQLTGMNWRSSSSIFVQTALAQGKPLPLDDWRLYERIYFRAAQLIGSAPVPWQPGAQELLHEMQDAGLAMGLVSASPLEVLDAGLQRMGQPFQVVVNGQQVANGKPAPDGYLMAAAKLGVAIHDCLVLEDSPSGTESGRRSGAPVIAIPGLRPIAPSPGQRIVETLQGVNLAQLRLWHAELVGQQASQ